MSSSPWDFVKPDVDNPRGHDIYLACVITPIVAGLFVVARAYSKVFIVKRVGADDWIAFVTAIFAIAFSVTLSQAPLHGMGLHESEFKAHPEWSKGNYFWIMVSSVFYVIALAGYKSALLVLYLHFFHMYKAFRWACIFWLVFTNAYLFSNLLTELGGCHPIQKFWDDEVPGHCIKYVACDIAYGACNVISDIAIAILPLPMIWRMKVQSKKDKIGLSLVLGSGAIAFVVAMIRFCYATIDLTATDRTWIAGKTFFWAVLEVWTGLVCSCTPSLKPLIREMSRKTIEWSSIGSSAFGKSRASVSRNLTKGSYDANMQAARPSLPVPAIFHDDPYSPAKSSMTKLVSHESEDWKEYGKYEMPSPMPPQAIDFAMQRQHNQRKQYDLFGSYEMTKKQDSPV